MRNVMYKLLGTQKERNHHWLECYANVDDEISIVICEEKCPNIGISLDIKTAIKLSKILQQEIRFIKTGKDE